MPKGYKHTEEAKRKISEARQRRKQELGYINSPEARRKIGETQRGRKQSSETVEKRRLAMRGRVPKNFVEFQKAGWESEHPSGQEVWNWKGNAVGYEALHEWVRRHKERPAHCERCGTTTASKYEWANISGEYKRDLADWQNLCVSCHRKLDNERNGYVPWNKGVSVQTNTGRTHIRPGEHLSPETEFKKGQSPNNKFLESRECPTCGGTFQPREANRKYCSRDCYWDSLRKKK